ncbi:MAG TPA: hypothetical protein DDX98_12775 [Bacteroidales bacterium]|jgi:GNAT superfamily N-acetyltransferase|nr:hypothetical protein [Bacteroidales bacterium]
MANTGEYQIRLIQNQDDIDTLVLMHKAVFSNVLSGQIGNGFLSYYYQLIIQKGFIYGCYNNDTLLAFISGTLNEKELGGIKFLGKALWGVLTHLSAKSIASLFRHIKRVYFLKDVTINAELLSIIVKEELRGKGIGNKLLTHFESHLLANHIQTYKVFTDLKYSSGSSFYEKEGFKLYREMNLLGLVTRLYIKKLSIKA